MQPVPAQPLVREQWELYLGCFTHQNIAASSTQMFTLGRIKLTWEPKFVVQPVERNRQPKQLFSGPKLFPLHSPPKVYKNHSGWGLKGHKYSVQPLFAVHQKYRIISRGLNSLNAILAKLVLILHVAVLIAAVRATLSHAILPCFIILAAPEGEVN